MNFNLIIPVAANKPDYSTQLPKVFSQDSDGTMMCVKAVLGLPLDVFDGIYFVLLVEHDNTFYLSEQLQLQFHRHKLENAHIILLEHPTRNQAETIYCAIKQQNISGSIFIKDADGFFKADEILPQNGITIYPLEELSLVDPQNKSYVAVDDMFYVTNVIEKRIVSHYFNAGGYCFEKAEDFCNYFEQLKDFGQLYLSHIIYSMLLEKHMFRPITISDYQDWELKSIIR